MPAKGNVAEAYREKALIDAVREPFDFSTLLIDWSGDSDFSKGEKTRFRLLSAMCDALTEQPFSKIRVANVCKRAGLSYGSFYHYFEDKDALIEELMTAFMDAFYQKYSEIRSTGDRYWDVYWPIYFYIEAYDRNRGLMRVMTENLDQLPKVRKAAVSFLNRWHNRLIKSFPEEFGDDALSRPDQSIVAHLLGGMLDSLMHQIFIIENSDINEYRNQKSHLAELCANVWYRAAFAQSPDIKSVERARRIVGRYNLV